jgi:hypothetical protein
MDGGLVTQHTTGSEVLAGGAYGPKGGLVAIVFRLVVIAFVVATTSLVVRRSAEVGTPGPGRTV